MRALRKIVGFLVAVVGLLVLIAGAILSFGVVGSDDTITMRAKDFSSAGVAVVTAPELLGITNATLKVDVKASDPAKRVFVGVAHQDDVTSYLASRAYTQVRAYALPDSLTMAERSGASTPVAAPTGLDWWVAKGSGTGSAGLTWAMTDDNVVLVVMNADGQPSLKTTADVGLVVQGAFTTSLIVVVGGLLLLLLGSAIVFGQRKKAGGTDTAALVGSDPHGAATTPPTTTTSTATTSTATTSTEEMAR